MIRRDGRRLILCLAFPAFVSSLFLGMAESGGDPGRFLPQDGEIQGWKRERPLQHYAGEALYEYINGGAEIYHEYGFRQVAVQDYVHASGKSVSVEIFEMETPEDAYGMYAFKTNVHDEAVPLGNEGRLADYYLNFWKGAFLVTLTGFDETGETVEGLLAMAHGVDSKMEPVGRGEKPLILSLLPSEGLEARSLKYFKGLLGLRGSHPFFNLETAGFEEGVKGDYADGWSLFLIRFGEEGECRRSFVRLKGEYADIPGYEEHEDSVGFLAKDSRGRRFFVSAAGNYLLIGMGDIDAVKAKEAILAIKAKINRNTSS